MATGTKWTLADQLLERYSHWTGGTIEYDVRPYFQPLDRIATHDVARLSDDELRTRASALESTIGTTLEDRDRALPEVFALAREGAARLLGLRPFDVQLAAGVALYRGRLAQLATGEGKTLVAVLPAILRALSGEPVHIFTANDYLARRDAEWMGPLYRLFGLDVASVVQGMTTAERQRAYAADVVYVTAKEAGFDYLRDFTTLDPSTIVHRGHHHAIVDEADFILIDEARVPLVIAGPAPDIGVEHGRLAALVRELRQGVDYTSDEYGRTCVLSEAGFARVAAQLGVRLDAPEHHLLLSAVHVALHAETLLKRDRDYVVRDGRVEIVDEWTGRVAENRRWPHGIQPAVEAKEGVAVRREGRILGAMPMQHFIRLYGSLAAMTATAEPAADEFHAFFGLRTAVFPPNRRRRRVDEPDIVFATRPAKLPELVREIATVHATGRPVLVGTVSVRESEDLAARLTAAGIACRVLNARQDADEARIIARAGTLGAVTISTNMAGRGTDIVLGGGDRAMHETVAALGGLYVIGTNRHESRRVDDQLRGRAGRQGDPGSSRFFISLEDDLIQRYGVMSLIPPAHRPAPGTTRVDDPVVAREIARAQRIVEGQNFDIRRTLWKYSSLVEEQRRVVYRWRESLLLDEADPGFCAEDAAAEYAALVASAGADHVRRAEQLILIHRLDRGWSEHLALIEDIREGIHLQRYGGKEPLAEFHKQIVQGFAAMMDGVRAETVATFVTLKAVDGAIDLAKAGIGGSSSTWTYLVDDNPFSTLGLSLMANRNVGVAASAGFIAVVYAPISLAIAAAVFLRRWLAKRRAS